MHSIVSSIGMQPEPEPEQVKERSTKATLGLNAVQILKVSMTTSYGQQTCANNTHGFSASTSRLQDLQRAASKKKEQKQQDQKISNVVQLFKGRILEGLYFWLFSILYLLSNSKRRVFVVLYFFFQVLSREIWLSSWVKENSVFFISELGVAVYLLLFF